VSAPAPEQSNLKNMSEDPKLEQIQSEAKSLSNFDLLEDVIEMAEGDDYDGLFTPTGRIRFNAFYDELEDRLIQCGFLDEKAAR
jgi:hypothetical protein